MINWIEKLEDCPNDVDALREIEALIGTESTTWPVAYITTPFLARAAERVTICERAEHALMIGLSFLYSGAHSIDERPKYCPEEVFPAYRESLQRGVSLLMEVIPTVKNEGDARWYISALAGLLGWPRLGELMTYECCIHCGEPLSEE